MIFSKFLEKKFTSILNFNFISTYIIKPIRHNKNYIVAFIDSHIIHYPTPINLNYAWSFGSLSGLCLIIQIITGLFLAMHYTPHIDLAFSSVEHIMRDVNNGWLIRFIHANGASMFFIVLPDISTVIDIMSEKLHNCTTQQFELFNCICTHCEIFAVVILETYLIVTMFIF